MNAGNLLNLYATWYKDISYNIDELWGDLIVSDHRTGCEYRIHTMDMIMRTFRDLGATRKAWGKL